MHDTIHQYLNQFNITMHKEERSRDTIQSNLNRTKKLTFAKNIRPFQCVYTKSDTWNKLTQGKTIARVL